MNLPKRRDGSPMVCWEDLVEHYGGCLKLYHAYFRGDMPPDHVDFLMEVVDRYKHLAECMRLLAKEIHEFTQAVQDMRRQA